MAFKLKEIDCAACHLDPHQGTLPRCTACHDTRRFRPTTIDVAAHGRYKFALDGAHAAVPCITCHKELQHAPTTSSLILAQWTGPRLSFTTPAGGCAACHATPHGAQFVGRRDRGACESCHGVDQFRPAAKFDHEHDASFSLKGAHAHVPCARCHPTSRSLTGQPMVVYKPVSAKCESCHDKETRRGS
jgi:hypothetical protein